MEQLKVGDKAIIKTQNGELKGVITGIIQLKYGGVLEMKDKIGDVKDEKTVYTDFIIKVDNGMIHRVCEQSVFPLEEEKPKETIPFKIIGAEIEDCKILWNRIDHLNLEFSVEGRANIITILKVLIKYLDLREFTYERICLYKVIREYPCNNEEKNHIFSIKYVDFI